MAIFGPIIETVRQLRNTKNLSEDIASLKKIDESDVLDLVSEESKIQSRILLKQAEHHYKSTHDYTREDVSIVEQEIIELMDENLKEKREKLSKKTATQLDIAQTLRVVQKLSNTVNDGLSRQAIESNIKHQKSLNSIEKVGDYLKNRDDELENRIEDNYEKVEKLDAALSILSEKIIRLEDNLESLQNTIKDGVFQLNSRIESLEIINKQIESSIKKAESDSYNNKLLLYVLSGITSVIAFLLFYKIL